MPDTDSDEELLAVTLDVWHPDCWGISSTEAVGTGIVGHGAAIDGTSGYERVSIYGESPAHVDQAVAVAEESPFIEAIETLGPSPSPSPVSSPASSVDGETLPATIGGTARDAFIEYDATDGMGSAFLSRGYVLDSSYRVESGIETWDLLVYATRSSFRRSLDEIRAERDADVTLTRISPARQSARGAGGTVEASDERLTPRQREALSLARKRGYYEWPRSVSAGELADELSVSKATFLEHLRKAEAEILGGDP